MNKRTYTDKELNDINLGNNITAQWFLHGICGVFALAIHEQFGYDIEILLDAYDPNLPNEIIHIYNTTEEKFMDIRGLFSNKDEFLNEFSDLYEKPVFQKIPAFELKEKLLQEMTEKELNEFLQKATRFIQTHKARYKGDSQP